MTFWHVLLAASCLVLVFEGGFLFIAPHAWQRMAEQMRQLRPGQLRVVGGVVMAIGVILLRLVV